MNIDIEKLLKALDWVLSKATIFTGIFAAIGALSWAAATALKLPYFGMSEATQRTLEQLGVRVLAFWLVLAVLTIIVQLKKNAKQAAAIAAEAIRRNKALLDVSVVPAVQREITKQIVDGAPVEPAP